MNVYIFKNYMETEMERQTNKKKALFPWTLRVLKPKSIPSHLVNPRGLVQLHDGSSLRAVLNNWRNGQILLMMIVVFLVLIEA